MAGTMTVVIPVYNEIGNAVPMAKALREAYPGFRVLFMDDNSTDGTIEAVRGMDDPMVEIHVRDPQKRGLAASVLEGFETAETDYAMCMDCDFQHPVSQLQGIYDRMEQGADLCVGVRTSRGSMGFKRSAASHIMEVFCKLTFMVHRKQTTRDMMSGLFAIRTETFREEISSNWDNFEYCGWKVLMDLLKYNDKPLKVAYSRYDFASREVGESHLNPKVPIMTVHQLWGFGRFAAKVLCKMYHVDYYGLYPGEAKRR